MAVWLINPQGPAGPRAGRPVVRPEPATIKGFDSLTRREREIVGAAVRGASNAQIAAGTYLSPITVETHVNSAMIKLDVRDRAQLVSHVSRAGLLG